MSNSPITTMAAWFGGSVLDMLFLLLLVLSAILLASVPWFVWFRQELRFLNNEIGRTHGREQERWKKKKRRLLLSIIPFVKYE